MKEPGTTMKRIDPALMAAALAADLDTPVYDPDNPPTTAEEFANAIVSHSLPELREKLAARRRGKGKKPAKVVTTLRLPADLLERWRATGPGWQTRMVERLAL